MTLKPSTKFSLSLPGMIWQTAVDATAGIWALEVRNQETQHIDYRLIFLEDAEMEELTLAETDWWTMLLKIRYPLVFFEKYNDPQNPADKDLILYDFQKKEQIKTLKQFQLETIDENQLRGCNPAIQSEKKGFSLESSGVRLSAGSSDNVHYPNYFTPASENMSLVNAFLEAEPSGLGCEYFERGDYIIISYYVRLGRKFDRKLLVLKGDDEIYHEVQDSEMKGYASGAFFVFKNLLVFIKNGNQINGVEL